MHALCLFLRRTSCCYCQAKLSRTSLGIMSWRTMNPTGPAAWKRASKARASSHQVRGLHAPMVPAHPSVCQCVRVRVCQFLSVCASVYQCVMSVCQCCVCVYWCVVSVCCVSVLCQCVVSVCVSVLCSVCASVCRCAWLCVFNGLFWRFHTPCLRTPLWPLQAGLSCAQGARVRHRCSRSCPCVHAARCVLSSTGAGPRHG